MNDKTVYRGNSNLKNSGIDLEYTQEQIEEILKCKDDPIYFIKKYIKIISLDRGLVDFELYDYQETLINLCHDNKRICAKMPRQVGKTTTVAAYVCHYITFNQYKTAAILGNKESIAREILSRIKLMVEQLPKWLQSGITEWNKGNIKFDNGCEIIASATSSSAIRGRAVAMLILDEYAFISKGVYEDFINSVYPTVASSKEAKIIIISTPFGLNHFYKMCMEAKNEQNGFKYLEVLWNQIPGRDEEFKKKTIAELGSVERWRQEFEGSFIGSGDTLLSAEAMNKMPICKPVDIQMLNSFRIYEQPQKDKTYIMFVDVSEGLGKDNSTCQIIDITSLPYVQVACYENNEIRPLAFHEVINKIGIYYNECIVVVETNNYKEVVNNLNSECEYSNIFYSDDFGIKTTKKTKKLGCGNLKLLIEVDNLIVKDHETINEFGNFSADKKGSYSAKQGYHDDLVMPLVNFAYWINNKEFTNLWLDEENLSKKLNKGQLDDINDNLIPCTLFCDDGLDDD
jgi:hypothetical protein